MSFLRLILERQKCFSEEQPGFKNQNYYLFSPNSHLTSLSQL